MISTRPLEIYSNSTNLGLPLVFSNSIQLFLRLFPFAALAVVGEIIIQIIDENTSVGSGLIFASVIVWAYLAYYAHAALLLPETRNKSEDTKRVVGFALRTFGLGLLMMVPVFIGGFVIFSQMLGDSEATKIGWSFLAVVVALAAISFLLVFGLLGTVLPAFVADKGRGLGIAWKRGASQFFWIVGHMLIGPIVLYAISAIIVIGGLIYLEPNSNMLGENYIPNIPVFLVMTVSYLIQALGTVMIAWVLSTAFRRADGPV